MKYSRRGVITFGALSLLCACSRRGYSVVVTVQPSAIDVVLEIVRSFAAQHHYQPEEVVNPGPNDLYYRGRWSFFSFYAQENMTEDSFVAEFRHQPEILLPRDDLETWLKEFVGATRQVEGVFVPEGCE